MSVRVVDVRFLSQRHIFGGWDLNGGIQNSENNNSDEDQSADDSEENFEATVTWGKCPLWASAALHAMPAASSTWSAGCRIVAMGASRVVGAIVAVVVAIVVRAIVLIAIVRAI